MRAQLLHLHGPLRGHTLTYDAVHLLVGSDPDAQVGFPADTQGIQARHAEIAYREEDCLFYIQALQGQVFVNGKQIKEIVLQHGDMLEFGAGGPRARFRIHMRKGTVCKPVRQMLGDASEVGQADGAFAFSQSFIRDLFTHATLTLKVGFPLIILILVLGTSYAAGWLGAKRKVNGSGTDLAQIMRELETSREVLAKSEAEMKELREQVQRTTPVVEELIAANAALQKVLKEYAFGVCLIHGIYGYRRPNAKDPSKMTELLDSNNRPWRSEYVGSGFMASSKGHVVTNRHVGEPWWRTNTHQQLQSLGFKPYFLHFTATFPKQKVQVVDPKTVKVSATEDVDIAVFRVAAKGIPVLPLHKGSLDSMRGGKVIVLGYPTGVNAILTKLEPKTYGEIVSGVQDLKTLIKGLAARSFIQPHVTQGALGQIMDKQLVYDAVTTSGGSGGPVFNAKGLVIGVNAAIQKDFTGSNFGVPVKYVLPLLEP